MDTPYRTIAVKPLSGALGAEIEGVAEEYLEDLEIYENSPNRAHHLPYIQAIAACKDVWDIRMLIETIQAPEKIRHENRKRNPS